MNMDGDTVVAAHVSARQRRELLKRIVRVVDKLESQAEANKVDICVAAALLASMENTSLRYKVELQTERLESVVSSIECLHDISVRPPGRLRE